MSTCVHLTHPRTDRKRNENPGLDRIGSYFVGVNWILCDQIKLDENRVVYVDILSLTHWTVIDFWVSLPQQISVTNVDCIIILCGCYHDWKNDFSIQILLQQESILYERDCDGIFIAFTIIWIPWVSSSSGQVIQEDSTENRWRCKRKFRSAVSTITPRENSITTLVTYRIPLIISFAIFSSVLLHLASSFSIFPFLFSNLRKDGSVHRLH